MLADQRLIRDIIKKGSKQAADDLVRRYYDDLYYYLFRQLGNRDDALDLTQEAFIAALNSLASFDARKSAFRTWLFRIGTYKVIDSRRKRQLKWLTLEEEDWVEYDDIDETLYQHELLSEINDFVARFQPDIQEIYHLRVYGGSSFPEIAALLTQKEEKVKAQYYRLNKKIRKEFTYHG